MKVTILFPDGDCMFSMDLDAIPRKGEYISFGRIDASQFSNEIEFQKYIDEEYEDREWYVDEVSWQLDASYTYAILTLAEDTGPVTE